MSFLFLSSIALAGPATLTGSLRGGLNDGFQLGPELRLDDQVFARVRVQGFRAGGPELHAIMAERAALFGGTPPPMRRWLARAGRFEIGGHPVPAIRATLQLDSTRYFTRRGQEYLLDGSVMTDTTGTTRSGVGLGVVLPLDPVQIVAAASLRVPTAAGRPRGGGLPLPVGSTGQPFAPRQLHGAVAELAVESRVTLDRHWTLDVDLSATTVGPSRYDRALGLPWSPQITPSVVLGLGWRGLLRPDRDTPTHAVARVRSRPRV
jgi:hypothetical protein